MNLAEEAGQYHKKLRTISVKIKKIIKHFTVSKKKYLIKKINFCTSCSISLLFFLVLQKKFCKQSLQKTFVAFDVFSA